jgi:hypothetical protein
MSGKANTKQLYFDNLEKNNLFSFDSTPDRVVFYFIFMPIIRHEINEFVLTWNAHRIRTRPDLPNSVGGIPDLLYYHPKEGLENCGKEPDLDRLRQHARQFETFGTCRTFKVLLFSKLIFCFLG